MSADYMEAYSGTCSQMNSVFLLSMATRIVTSIPFCDMDITVVEKFPNGDLARTNGIEIILSSEIRRSEVRWAMTHECMHQFQMKNVRHDELYMFGRRPFITDYASTNYVEDFAEVATATYLGQVVRGRKGAFVRKLFKKHSIEY